MWRTVAPGLAVLALLGAAYWLGHGKGRAAERASMASEIAALELRLSSLSEANRKLAADLEQRRAAQAILVEEIENEARTDPDALRRVPSADSLRWLERRWGSPP